MDVIANRYASPAYDDIYASECPKTWRLRGALQSLEDAVANVYRAERTAREWAKSYFDTPEGSYGRELRKKTFREYMLDRRAGLKLVETIRRQIADLVV